MLGHLACGWWPMLLLIEVEVRDLDAIYFGAV